MASKPDLEEKLRRTELELERVQNEFRDFIYSIAHELSGPLRQSSGFAEMILRNNADNLDEKTKKHLNIIVSSALTGRESLEALRNYTATLQNQTDFEEHVEIKDCVDTALSQLKTENPDLKFQIEIKELPTLSCNRANITQLFYQLIKNATLFQIEGQKPVIKIKATQKGKGVASQFWEFHIEDNGIGIIPHRLEDVFKPFKRCHTRTEYPGDGIGLTIAKSVVKSHFGDIWIDKDVSAGTRVGFTLRDVSVPI